MVRNFAGEILNLIKQGKGLEKADVYSNPNVDFKKILEIILNESKCSVIDSHGNYARYGSSIDIRIVNNLVKTFLSNSDKIQPEIVSMSLTNEEILRTI